MGADKKTASARRWMRDRHQSPGKVSGGRCRDLPGVGKDLLPRAPRSAWGGATRPPGEQIKKDAQNGLVKMTIPGSEGQRELLSGAARMVRGRPWAALFRGGCCRMVPLPRRSFNSPRKRDSHCSGRGRPVSGPSGGSFSCQDEEHRFDYRRHVMGVAFGVMWASGLSLRSG